MDRESKFDKLAVCSFDENSLVAWWRANTFCYRHAPSWKSRNWIKIVHSLHYLFALKLNWGWNFNPNEGQAGRQEAGVGVEVEVEVKRRQKGYYQALRVSVQQNCSNRFSPDLVQAVAEASKRVETNRSKPKNQPCHRQFAPSNLSTRLGYFHHHSSSRLRRFRGCDHWKARDYISKPNLKLI